MTAAADHFSRVADGYSGLRGRWPLSVLRAREQAAVRRLMPVAVGERVLDAGCGDGEILAWLCSRRARPVGIDVVPAMAQRARRCGAPVAVQDFAALGVRPVFDWALCIGAIEFAGDPVRVLRELGAALRAGGRVGLLFPRRSALARVYAAYHRRHGVAIRLFSHAEMNELLGAAGLVVEPPWLDCLLSTVCVARRASGTGHGAG
ncbi:MAG: methyltransferase domain-containing protein [bacterium]